MKKSLFLLVVLLCAIFITGCSREKNVSLGKSLRIEEYSSSSQPSSGGQSVTDPSESSEPEFNQAFYENVLIDFGAHWNTENNGAAYLIPDASSLFYWDDWGSPEEVPVSLYFMWLFQWAHKNDYGVFHEFNAEPPENGYAVDADFFENTVTNYFDLSADYLRSDIEIYDAVKKEYRKGVYGGMSTPPEIEIIRIESKDSLDYIHIALHSIDETAQEKVIVIHHLNDKSYRFVGYHSANMLPSEQDKSSRADHDALAGQTGVFVPIFFIYDNTEIHPGMKRVTIEERIGKPIKIQEERKPNGGEYDVDLYDGISVVYEGDVATAIMLLSHGNLQAGDKLWKTNAGIGIGSGEEEVSNAYPLSREDNTLYYKVIEGTAVLISWEEMIDTDDPENTFYFRVTMDQAGKASQIVLHNRTMLPH